MRWLEQRRPPAQQKPGKAHAFITSESRKDAITWLKLVQINLKQTNGCL
jgi:hypothetical protein